jgi:hypothetical protein
LNLYLSIRYFPERPFIKVIHILGKIKRTISDMVVCTSTGKASADYIFCGTNSGDIVKLYVDFLANGQAHHMFSRFLNL